MHTPSGFWNEEAGFSAPGNLDLKICPGLAMPGFEDAGIGQRTGVDCSGLGRRFFTRRQRVGYKPENLGKIEGRRKRKRAG